MKRRDFIALASVAPFIRPEISFRSHSFPKKWIWGRYHKITADQIKKLKSYGITGLLSSSINPEAYKRVKDEGLEFHYWTWTMNMGSKKPGIPKEWYSVNKNGISCYDDPPYVGYYRWLCPSREEVQEYSVKRYAEYSQIDHIDGVHLDYVRHPDVILPKGLWKKYNLIQNEELPEFDFCYCNVCREKFKLQSGVDPMHIKDPEVKELWRQYRLDGITNIVNKIAHAVHQTDKPLSAAVFPSPSIASNLVRQEWHKWDLDAVFPMLYYSFYEAGPEWLLEHTAEGVSKLENRIPLFAGLFYTWNKIRC